MPPDKQDYSCIEPEKLKMIDVGDIYEALRYREHDPDARLSSYQIQSSISECCMWLANPYEAAKTRNLRTSDGRIVFPWRDASTTLGILLRTAPQDVEVRWGILLDYAFFRCVRACAADLSLVIIVVLTWVEFSLQFMNAAHAVASALIQHVLVDVPSAGLQLQQGKFRVSVEDLHRLAQHCGLRALRNMTQLTLEVVLDWSCVSFHVPFLANDPQLQHVDHKSNQLRNTLRDQILMLFDCSDRHNRHYVISRPEAIVNLFHADVVLPDASTTNLQGTTSVTELFAVVALLPMSFWFAVRPYVSTSDMPVNDDHPQAQGVDPPVLELWLKVLNRKTSLKLGRPWRKELEAEHRLYKAFRHHIAVDRWILSQWIRHAGGPVRHLVHDVLSHVSTFLFRDHTFPRNFFRRTFTVTKEQSSLSA